MKIKFLGADETVTGSRHLLIGEKTNLLIDCGLYQGHDFIKQNNKLARLLKQEHIDAIVLTHAHLDHAGFLPKLFRSGFKGPVFCTHGTKDLCEVILKDNARIQQKNLKKDNKVEEELFYSEPDVTHALSYFQCHNFNEEFKYKEFTITFNKAGHILGASSPIIKNKNNSIQFSGDLGRFSDLMMKEPELASSEVQNICMESTYGNRIHPINYARENMIQVLEQNKLKKGTILIPAFSVGRSQVTMLLLHQIFTDRPELKIPVYIDSAMTSKVNEIYFKYLNETKINKSLLNQILNSFITIEYASQREALLKNNSAKIILTASGMMSGGHIMQYLPVFGTQSNSTLMVMGYQSEDTLGHDIVSGIRQITIEDKEFLLEANVVNFLYLSSHLDHNGLLSWLQYAAPKKLILVHGEQEQITNLKDDLNQIKSFDIHIAHLGETLNL